jgi:hypothetical protein
MSKAESKSGCWYGLASYKHRLLCSVQAETYEFWAAETERSSLRMLKWTLVLAPLGAANSMATCSFVRSPWTTAGSLLPNLLVWGWLLLFRANIVRYLKMNPIFVGSALHGVVQLSWMYAAVMIALAMPTEVQQHRLFVGMYHLSFACAGVLFFLPGPLFVGLVCPIYWCGWLLFHAVTQSFQLLYIVHVVLLTGIIMYMRHLHTEAILQVFQASQAIKKQEQVLNEVKKQMEEYLETDNFEKPWDTTIRKTRAYISGPNADAL